MVFKRVKYAVLIVGILLLAGCSESEQPQPVTMMDETRGQAVFITPEQAAQAFTDALKNTDKASMRQIMGSDYEQLVSFADSGDVDAYLAAWKRSHELIDAGTQQRLISIGDKGWTFPVPVHEGDKGWYFDTDAGIERIMIRQIGRNELDTMQSVLAYYDAQLDYASEDRNGNGILEYAQNFVSSSEVRDGLYWDVTAGEDASPLGSLFAAKTDEDAYHGYRYKILKQQGNHARGGTYDYVDGARMDRGFALIAWPAVYADSGVTSFMVSHDGILYEQDLGESSAEIAAAMVSFDPDSNWEAEQEVR